MIIEITCKPIVISNEILKDLKAFAICINYIFIKNEKLSYKIKIKYSELLNFVSELK